MIIDLLKELRNKLDLTIRAYNGAEMDIEILMDMETYKEIAICNCCDCWVGLQYNLKSDEIFLFNHKINIIDSAQRILTLTIECEV